MQPVCWKCGAPLELIARQPGGVSKSTTTTRNWVVGFARRLFRPRDGHYEHTAAPYAPQVRQAPAPPVGCAPGETAYRVLNARTDLWFQLTMSAVCAALVGFPFLCAYVGVTYPVIWPFCGIAGGVDLVALVLFWRQNKDILWDGKDDRLVTRQRGPDATPTTAPRQWHVKAEMTDESGRHTLYDEFNITNAPAWHKFCKAVHFDGKNFSGAESKRHKVPPIDWTSVSTAWVNNGWLSAVTAGGIPEPKGPGKGWVKAYAETPPEEA